MAEPAHRGAYPPGEARERFLEEQPTYWLKRCYQSLRRTVDAGLRDYDLTLSQREVLLALYEEGPLDQTALRERSGLEQSSLSRLVDGLAKRGLIELRPGADRRIRIASITDTGTDLLHATPGASELGGEIMIAGLSVEERRELIRLLRRCSDNLSDRDGARPAGREITETTHEGASGHDEWK